MFNKISMPKWFKINFTKTEFENSIRRLNFLRHLTDIKIKSLIEKLADVVNKYNNTYQSTIKMKPADVK